MGPSKGADYAEILGLPVRQAMTLATRYLLLNVEVEAMIDDPRTIQANAQQLRYWIDCQQSVAYTPQQRANLVMALELCDYLERMALAALGDPPGHQNNDEKKEKDQDTRVVERTDSPLPVTTAGTDSVPPATVSLNQVSNEVIDTETSIRYHVIGRRFIDGDEWVDLALAAHAQEQLARSVRLGLFNRIFVSAGSVRFSTMTYAGPWANASHDPDACGCENHAAWCPWNPHATEITPYPLCPPPGNLASMGLLFDGNQHPSGLRGDPVVPGTVNVPTRDQESSYSADSKAVPAGDPPGGARVSLCLCGVVTGGSIVVNPKCPQHGQHAVHMTASIQQTPFALPAAPVPDDK